MDVLDWKGCCNSMTLQQVEAIAAERAVSAFNVERIGDRGWIGSCYVPKWRANCIAFPICLPDGQVWRAHCRAPQRNEKGKFEWTYEPAVDLQDQPISALLFGVLGLRTHTVFIQESQWCNIALVDKLDLIGDIDAGEVCLIATRGVDFAGRLRALTFPPKATSYAIPQNDDGGCKWLENVRRSVTKFLVVRVPEAFKNCGERIKDLGEWVQNGAAASDIEAAIQYAKPFAPSEQTPSADSDRETQPESETSFKPGRSIIELARASIDPGETLLGSRYLCRGAGRFVIAPTGGGKSTLSIQNAILWACGLPYFGVPAVRPLRNLIIQAEDDNGDQIEMARMIDHIILENGQRLSQTQIEMIHANTEIIRCAELVGERFFVALRRKLARDRADLHPWDLVTINPYTSFLGADVRNTEAAVHFLRERLTPILLEFAIATDIIHHTAKTNFVNTDNYKLWDWMYYGAGCAEISNWARAIMVMKPVSDDMKVFRFIAAKRGMRIGGEWENVFEKYFAHSPDSKVLCWQEATAEQLAKATAQASGYKFADLDKALTQVPLIDPEQKPTVVQKIQKACKVGRNPARDALNELILTGKVFEIDIPNPKKGPGRRDFVGVCKTPPWKTSVAV
jgi:hypothetical protein